MIADIPKLGDLSPQNPWPGLRAFTEDDSEFFFGRDRETAELLDLVQRTSVVVLYGQSGLGKTSLLQAGLFPGLKRSSFLPIRMRFDHNDGAPPLADQIKTAIAFELDRARVTGPRPSPGETLWEYFHRQDVDFWGARNRLLTPVIVLDQFEEVFTLGQRSTESANRVSQFAMELESLLEHRPPEAVRERLEAHQDEAQQYDLRKQAVKFVVTLREDFLADLDPWRIRMPSLLPNRFRLERMTGAQALDVVQRAGNELIEPSVAHDIVDFVSTSRRRQTARAMEQRDVEPAILSVVCDELNRRRIELGQSKITGDLLSGEREEIIRSFYERSFEGLDPRVRTWVEDELLTASGYRDRGALEDALKQGLPEADFDQLVNHRILHREERSGVVWLELTHDLLTDPASESRSLREQRRQADAAKKQAEDARKQKEKYERDLRKSRILTAVFGVLLIGTGAALFYAVTQSKIAAQKSLETQKMEVAKERGYQAAAEMAERQSFGIGGGWVPAATVRQIIDDTEKSYVSLASQGTSSHDQQLLMLQRHANFLTQAAEAYYQVGQYDDGLTEARAALDLIKQLGTAEPQTDPMRLLRAEAIYEEGSGLLTQGQIDPAKNDFTSAIGLTSSITDPNLKRDMTRVYVLSQIGIGQAEVHSLSYEKALPHFNDAIQHIDTNLSTDDIHYKDEALTLRVEALVGGGSSQWNEAQALEWYTKASSALSRAGDLNNPRWKRIASEVAYFQGFSSLRLAKYEDAKESFSQAIVGAEDLCNRDPDNLLWQLDLLQAQRGLGLVYEDRGELDLSQENLDKALKLAKELNEKQPAWARAAYLRGILVMGLGDVLERKYSEALNSQKNTSATSVPWEADPKDLNSAFDSYKESREILQKAATSDPGYLDFLRYVSIAMSEQGGLRAMQANALIDKEDKNDKAAQKRSEDAANQKRLEALDFYNQAFRELAPLGGGPAKESPEILQDKAGLYKSIAAVQLGLKDQKKAISSYTEAIQTLKDLVKKAPSPENYRRLSLALLNLGDVYRSSKDISTAQVQFNLAMDAIKQTLRDEPKDSGALNVKSVIQSRFADVLISQGDPGGSLDQLEQASGTLWSALQTDYSDELLNSNLDYYIGLLGRIRSALQDTKKAAGSQNNKMTADQADALLKRVATLDAKIEPTLLLSHYGQTPWSLPPLLPGAWRTLGGEERTVALRQLFAFDKNLNADQIRGIRKLPLNFYDDAALYELEMTAGANRDGIISFVQHGKDWTFLDGSAAPVQEINRKSPPRLDTPERAMAYLRFFMGAIQKPDQGTFVLIDQKDDILWLPSATDAQRKNASEIIEPLIVEASPDGEWEGIGTIEYAGYLYGASFRLSRNGIVTIERAKGSGSILPVYIGSYCDGIRVRTTMDALPKEKDQCDIAQAKQKLDTNPRDKEALRQLLSLYEKDQLVNEEVEVVKTWLAANPNDKDGRLQLIRLYERLNRWDDALEIEKNWLAAAPNDRDALEQLPFVYTGAGRWNDAVQAENNWIAYVQREVKDENERRVLLGNAYLGLSWSQLFTRDFSGALTSTDAGEKLKVDKSDLHIDTNRAHALLFLGRIPDANAIYLGNSGKKIAPNSDETWNDAVLQDFDDLEKGGLTSPEFARLRKLLQPQKK
ncbi:MAG TPA: AAA family ATPase [Candidatus Acidoferrales bacterium]|jgi:tetratricopeptide (TPR) repeat protein|nr:AAA family ATPase [Candidatus Acidoferrales bacterium]